MHGDFPEVILRLLFETVCYPVRNSPPIVVLAYVLALFVGIVMIGYAITQLIPTSPYQP